jgi:hypothetical protein
LRKFMKSRTVHGWKDKLVTRAGGGPRDGSTYRTHTARDDAVKGESFGDPMGHAAAARVGRVME